MRWNKILVPTDFSTASDEALAYAAGLARASGGTLFVIHVEEPPISYGVGEMYYGVPMPNTDDLLRMLYQVQPADLAVRCEHRLVLGEAVAGITGFAEREKVDLIVMSTHGRTGVARALMGSVAEGVLRRAPCPVLTLKARLVPPAKKQTPGEAAPAQALPEGKAAN